MIKPVRSLPDTNILIRYLTRDDEPLYVRAKEFFDKVKEGSIRAVILESVIAECVYVLAKIYKAPKTKAAESLIDILRYKGIANLDRGELIRALTLFSERDMDIADCILCVKASGSNTSLFSFDNDLNKMSESNR
ncbi:MAG: PIN domain-containing protein [Syntrophobacteraceae bacterium]